MTKNYWLLKTEPDTFSIDDLKRVKKEDWTGVRNYQARNNMLAMSVGDICFFYHSSCETPAIAGLCKVSKIKVVDETQFDKKSVYFDPKSTQEKPRWYCVDVEFVEKFSNPIPLASIRVLALKNKTISEMVLVRMGSRLSVQPVTERQYDIILKQFSTK
jgi:predicted RNA-binding protein with PUA-like domain